MAYFHNDKKATQKMSVPLLMVLTGFFLLPFENTAIAPSSGWPAIAPVFFLGAFIMSGGNGLITKSALMWGGGFILCSFVGWASAVSVIGWNRYFLCDLFEALPPLILGYVFYAMVRKYFFSGGCVQVEMVSKCLKSFFLGSCLALIVSLFLLIFGVIMKLGGVISLSSFLLKRNGDLERFSFLFAEPSFVSVHILGVLVPFAWIAWRLGLKKRKDELVILVFIYIIISVLFMTSARFSVDVFFLAFVWFVFSKFGAFDGPLGVKGVVVFLLCVFGVFITISYPGIVSWLTFGRVDIGEGFRSAVNSDASLAARFFRTDAAVSGLNENPILWFTGVGFGNVGLLVDEGFSPAFSRFTSFFTKEVFQIYDDGNGSNVFNMFVRFCGEFGVLVSVAVICKLYDKNMIFLYVITLWCYVQFDSYSFYAIWIYLIACGVSRCCRDGKVRSLG